ncbi:SHSP domain-containing protein [Psidium guajava]|nr:SHSP domain-containing protein [Psidium guajava]
MFVWRTRPITKIDVARHLLLEHALRDPLLRLAGRLDRRVRPRPPLRLRPLRPRRVALQLPPSPPRQARASILRSLPYALRAGLAHLAMLAVMSFDGGVFLAAVAAQAAGFLAFTGGALGKPEEARGPHVGEGHHGSASRELLIRGGSKVGGEILDIHMMT